MPTLIFSNGKHKKVTYDQAARINDVLMGYKEPENEKQAKFCESVAGVEFESPVKENKKDEIMQEILNKKYEHGHDKFVAVARRIAERNAKTIT